ncbi:hypothetical protein [Actinosynnema sp. NPDC020468]|uniref:hypothetical protein n=1 Tax=Actinosynnema sp. NPDC020468 TaxID=3154488 RepID=UPI003400A23C
MPEAVAQWWDGVELWLAQLPFPFQFGLLMCVLLPLALGVARLIDRVVDDASARINPVRDSGEDVNDVLPPGAGKVESGS